MRTGTNYLTTTILNNFLDVDVFMNIGGWKNGKIIEFPNNINLINTVDKHTKKIIEIDKTLNLFQTYNSNKKSIYVDIFNF